MWINTTTRGEFVLHSDIRHELWKSDIEAPGVLTDEYLDSVGYARLVQVVPDHDEITQGLTPRPGELVNGVWEKHYDVEALDPAIMWNKWDKVSAMSPENIAIMQAAGIYQLEIVKMEVRRHRDQRLAACDWHGASDNVMSAEMTAYRQALRDVPAQDGFPSEVIWPDRPHR
jgi:hypothetical protein